MQQVRDGLQIQIMPVAIFLTFFGAHMKFLSNDQIRPPNYVDY